MGEELRVSRWGASLAVRIPGPIAEQWGVQEGSTIEIVPVGDGVVMRKKVYDLDDMLSQVNARNLHLEENTGPPQGNEEW